MGGALKLKYYGSVLHGSVIYVPVLISGKWRTSHASPDHKVQSKSEQLDPTPVQIHIATCGSARRAGAISMRTGQKDDRRKGAGWAANVLGGQACTTR